MYQTGKGLLPRQAAVERDVEDVVDGAVRPHGVRARDQVPRIARVGRDLRFVVLDAPPLDRDLNILADGVRPFGVSARAGEGGNERKQAGTTHEHSRESTARLALPRKSTT